MGSVAMSLLRRLFRPLRRFRKAEDGSLVVESIFIIPIMMLGFISFFAFWDVYKSQNMVQKGTYAVADMLSREMVPATPAFLDGLDRTLEFLIRRNANLRITSVRRISGGPTGTAGLDVLWSYSPGNAIPVLTDATVFEVGQHIPMMAVGSNMIIFEARVPYRPVSDILTVAHLNQTVAMRPRFLPTLCLQGVVC